MESVRDSPGAQGSWPWSPLLGPRAARAPGTGSLSQAWLFRGRGSCIPAGNGEGGHCGAARAWGRRESWPGSSTASFHGRAVVQPRGERSRGRLGKQAEPINKATWPPGRRGPGQGQAALPATKSRGQRPGINRAARPAAQRSESDAQRSLPVPALASSPRAQSLGCAAPALSPLRVSGPALGSSSRVPSSCPSHLAIALFLVPCHSSGRTGGPRGKAG